MGQWLDIHAARTGDLSSIPNMVAKTGVISFRGSCHSLLTSSDTRHTSGTHTCMQANTRTDKICSKEMIHVREYYTMYHIHQVIKCIKTFMAPISNITVMFYISVNNKF